MIIYLLADPLENSYVISLIEEYKRMGHLVYCGSRNFLASNIVPNILHIHWPEKIYNNYPFSALHGNEKLNIIEEKLIWFKKNKTIIVHTIHNLKPHNPLDLIFEKKVYNLAIKYSDVLIHHCNKSIILIKKEHPEVEKKLNIISNHPDYLYDYKNVSKRTARKKLKLPEDKFILLNFGSQQKYKGNDFIESVFRKLPFNDKYLLIAGNFVYDGYSNKFFLKMRNKYLQKVKFKNRKYIFRRITPEELPYIVSATDLFFLAHQKNSLNSGVLSLAATYSKPIVFPNIGCFEEQMKNWSSHVYSQDDEASAINAILNLYKSIKNNQINFDNSGWLKENSWNFHVSSIIKAVNSIKNSPEL